MLGSYYEEEIKALNKKIKQFNKKEIMRSYYNDEELKDMQKMSPARTLIWLEKARCFINKITPKATKKLQEKLQLEGW